MSKIKCPICNREYEDLGKLAACITAHDKDMKCKEKEEKEKRIQTIRKQNDTLYSQLKKNCEILRELGCIATASYSVSNTRTDYQKYSQSVNPLGISSLEKEINKILSDPKAKQDIKKNIVKDFSEIWGGDEASTNEVLNELSRTFEELFGGKK